MNTHFGNDRELIFLSSKMSIITFNMLADSLADSFPNVEPKFLTWSHRKPLIMSIISERLPDIIVLQECDKFDEINEELKANYNGLFAQKQGKHVDGVAIFVSKRIKIIQSYELKFNNGSQVACVAHLSLDNKHFALAGIHLKSSEFEDCKLLSESDFQAHKSKFEAIRLAQTVFVHKNLIKLDLPFIIVGDFNEEPDKASTTYLDAMAISAYGKVSHHYTTYKKRTDTIKYQTIDHIYASKEFKIYSLLPSPIILDPYHLDPTVSKSEFLPNSKYPSDHMYLYVEYIL